MPKRTAAASGSQDQMVDVISVKPLGGYALQVAFSDGSMGVHDFSSTTARTGEMVRPLKDPEFFARVFVELGALTWPNGFDLDSIALHDRMSEAGELGHEAVVKKIKRARKPQFPPDFGDYNIFIPQLIHTVGEDDFYNKVTPLRTGLGFDKPEDTWWRGSVRCVVTWANQAIGRRSMAKLSKMTFRESLEEQGHKESMIRSYIGDCQLLVPLLIHALGEERILEQLNPYLSEMGLRPEDPNWREAMHRIVTWATEAIDDYRRRKLDG